MPDETKTVGYCAYSGQSLKGKQLREGGFHVTSDGVTHRLVRWAERRYEWVGDQLRHKVTGQLFDIHPNAAADAALAPQIEEHADPNEPKKERKPKATEAAQPDTQSTPPAEDDVPNAQPETKPEGDQWEAAKAEVKPIVDKLEEEAIEEVEESYPELEPVADAEEDEVVD